MDVIDLSEFFQTKAQAADFSARLSTVSESIYQNNFNLEKALTDQFGMAKKDKFMTIVRDNNVSIASVEQLKTFITKIQTDITNIPTLPLTIAFEPRDDTLKTLSDWFFLNLKRQVLFDLKVDRSLIAGATVTYNSKFLDFSVKAKFAEIVKNILHPAAQPAAVQHVDSSDLHIGR